MVKRTFDVAAALAGLVLTSPVLLLAALAIKLDSNGPIIFRQRRIGRNFRPFVIYKFRTMRESAEGGRAITADGDARITRVGRLLRKSKIDELPQLFNVLRGDMSIVGPRPELPRYVELFRKEYRTVLRVRPGITDPAAIAYRDESAILGRSADPDAEYVGRILPDKLRLSTNYVRNASLLVDIGLIARTLVALMPVARRPFARGAVFVLAFTAAVLLTRPAGEGADGPPAIERDAKAWYAAPDGRRDAGGSVEDPLDLATAIARRGPVRPGDTVWLKAGTYRGSYTSTIAGTASHPIVVRGADPWSVRIDAAGAKTSPLIVRGGWTVFRDLEIMNSNPDRRTLESGSRAADDLRRDGVVVYGAYTKLVNLIVHDNGDGIALWGPARGAEVYGCIVYGNGWVGPDRGHGHGLYIQSRADTKLVTDVVSFDNYATGMKAYAENGEVDGVEFDGVVSFNNGSPAAGGGRQRMPNLFVGSATVPANRVSLTNSFLYHPPGAETDLGGNLALGSGARGNGEAIVRSTYVVGGHRALLVREWRSVVVDASTFVVNGSAEGERPRLVGLDRASSSRAAPPAWDGNRYVARQEDGLFAVDGRRVDFRQWQELTGFDKSSDYTSSPPKDAEVFVRPNRHEPGRAHLIVFNWPRQSTVQVDLTTVGLRPEEAYEIRDVRDLHGSPIATGTGEAAFVSLPTGAAEFAVFLVRKK